MVVEILLITLGKNGKDNLAQEFFKAKDKLNYLNRKPYSLENCKLKKKCKLQ